MKNIRKIIKSVINEQMDFTRMYSNIPPGLDRDRIFGGGLDEIGGHTLDKINRLDDWYKEAKKEVDKIKDYKTWKRKSRMLSLQYLKQKEQLTKLADPYALKGDVKANFIYHYTTTGSLIEILNEDTMIGSVDDYGVMGVSFSTQPNLYKRKFIFWHPNKFDGGKHFKNVAIKIKYDFNEIKRDGHRYVKGGEDIGTSPGEEEIRIVGSEFENPIKYIREVIIFRQKEPNPELIEQAVDALNKNNIKHRIV